MVKAYLYELQRQSGTIDKVKFIVSSLDEQQAKNGIQSHYATNRKRILQYSGGNHQIDKSEIKEIPLTNDVLQDPSMISITL